MKTDSLIYKFFQVLPEAVFALLEREAPPNIRYEFTSVELKGHGFRIDGVLTPVSEKSGKSSGENAAVYFVEAQFRRDKTLYPRLFAEIMLYLHQYKRHGEPTDWQALALFPNRKADTDLPPQYHAFERNGQLRRLYLDDTPTEQTRLFPLNILRLIEESLHPNDLKPRIDTIIGEIQQAIPNENDQDPVLQIVLNILIEKFPDIARKELEAMMYTPTSKFFESRFYRELKEEAWSEGMEKGIEKGASMTIVRLAEQWHTQGRSVQEIAELLSLTPHEVRQLLSL